MGTAGARLTHPRTALRAPFPACRCRIEKQREIQSETLSVSFAEVANVVGENWKPQR